MPSLRRRPRLEKSVCLPASTLMMTNDEHGVFYQTNGTKFHKGANEMESILWRFYSKERTLKGTFSALHGQRLRFLLCVYWQGDTTKDREKKRKMEVLQWFLVSLDLGFNVAFARVQCTNFAMFVFWQSKYFGSCLSEQMSMVV